MIIQKLDPQGQMKTALSDLIGTYSYNEMTIGQFKET
jgi:hypothetical protein